MRKKKTKGEIVSVPNLSLIMLCRQYIVALVRISFLFRSQFLLLPQVTVVLCDWDRETPQIATISWSECVSSLIFALYDWQVLSPLLRRTRV